MVFVPPQSLSPGTVRRPRPSPLLRRVNEILLGKSPFNCFPRAEGGEVRDEIYDIRMRAIEKY